MKRTNFIKSSSIPGMGLLRVILVFFTALLSVPTNAQVNRPNILLIFADDLGYKDCGFTGSEIMETPNLDRLARAGMVFNNAYAAAGNCAPSRACLMSGKYTPRHGVYAVGSTRRGPVEEMKVVPVKNTDYLNPSFVTVAETLKEQGYATGIFGKWHLGTSPGTGPEAQGFDVYFDSRKVNPNKQRDEPDDPKGIFSLTDSAIAFMNARSNAGEPFFVFLSHHAIHSQQEARPSSLDKFKKKGLSDKMALYAACTYDLDASVGSVISFLKKSGLDKNTLVIFTSDNGATQQSSQEPLRGNKGCYYEGGIREPFIAYWPEKIKGGSVNSTPVINVDLYPTFLSLAGSNDQKTDGESLLPLFFGKSKTTRRKAIFWHFPGYLNKPVIRGRDSIFRTRPVTVIRKGDWKLHLFYEEWLTNGGKRNIASNRAIELYNINEDVGERHDLAGINTTKRDELLEDLLDWIKKVDAPMPELMTSDSGKP